MCRYYGNETEVAMTIVAAEDERMRMRDEKVIWWGEGCGTPKVAVYMEGRLMAVASEERRGVGGRAGESDSCGGTSDEEGAMRM